MRFPATRILAQIIVRIVCIVRIVRSARSARGALARLWFFEGDHHWELLRCCIRGLRGLLSTFSRLTASRRLSLGPH